MKVITADRKIKQTIASLRGAKADMEAFSMETEDQNARQIYTNCAQQIDQLVNDLKLQSRQSEGGYRQQTGYGAENMRKDNDNS